MSRRHKRRRQPDDRPLELELAGLVNELASRASRDGDRPVIFTSPGPESGCTTVCVATAILLASSLETDAALVDANLSAPGVADRLGFEPAPGLAEVLDGLCSTNDALRRIAELPGLCVLTAGGPREPRFADFGSRRMREVLSELGAGRRLVLVDSPPIGEAAAAAGAPRLAADVVLVLHAGRTRRSEAQEAARICATGGLRLLGTVLGRA